MNARSAASGAAWDQAGLDAARSAGLLEGLDEAALTGAVTRQDAALLLCNALPEEYTPSFWDQPIDPTALSDWGRMDSLRQEAVAELARQFRTTAPALSARLYRAKQQLRKKLEELGYEEALSEDF